MEAKDVVEIEAQIEKVIGRKCWIEYTRYSGSARLDVERKDKASDGLLRERLDVLPRYYNSDFVFVVKTDYDDKYGYDMAANWRMYQLPGCCGVCVSSAAQVVSPYRKKGLNVILNKFRIELAKHMKYSILLCSDIAANAPSKKTLVKNGWKDIYQFKNQRTNNVIDISVVNLT